MSNSEYPFHAPDGPQRPTRVRLAVLGVAVVPVCVGGWLGWQALAGEGAPAAPKPSSSGPAPASGVAALPSVPAAQPSPSTAATPGSANGKLNGRTVVLDPGHNPGNVNHTTEINQQVDIGNSRKECDTTGTSTDSGYSEADYTLDVVHRIRQILQDRGAKVVLTQDGDRPFGPCIDERAAIGNSAKADVAISVHGDGAPASGSGFHVIMPAKVTEGKADNSAIVEPSHRLGLLLRDTFKSATGEPYSDYIGQEALDTRSDLGGLNLSRVPKVFIETGNMRNPGDVKRMTDPQWRQLAAQGIADGLTKFLTG